MLGMEGVLQGGGGGKDDRTRRVNLGLLLLGQRRREEVHGGRERGGLAVRAVKVSARLRLVGAVVLLRGEEEGRRLRSRNHKARRFHVRGS